MGSGGTSRLVTDDSETFIDWITSAVIIQVHIQV